MAAGGDHTCATTATGALFCWGDNDLNQIGDGSGGLQPTALTTSESLKRIAAGERHTCGIKTSGNLVCWGANEHAQLGLVTSPEAADVPAPTAFMGETLTDLALGARHGCAIAETGAAFCWGANDAGQLGSSTAATDGTPNQVGQGQDWLVLTAGSAHTCGVRAVGAGGGSLWCWGDNTNGQVGQGQPEHGVDAERPKQVGRDTTWVDVSAGRAHTCAIRLDSTLWCWGDNQSGQVAAAADVASLHVPERVGEQLGWEAVAAGGDSTCGVRAGALYCWGRIVDSRVPTTLGASATWQAVSVGSAAARPHMCAVSGDTLACMGDNRHGQLGTGSRLKQPAPTAIGQADWAILALGSAHSCALRRDGVVLCWGADDAGQRGDGTTDVPAPVRLAEP